MTIKDFDNFRAGSAWPAAIDISPILGHESGGVKAVASEWRAASAKNYLQIIALHDDLERVGLFSFAHDDMELPPPWKDGEVIYDSRRNDGRAQ